MRRKDREITDLGRMLEILEACDCCRIGLVDEDEAYILPMNFGYELCDGKITLYFHGASEGRKAELIPKQKRVSFEMDTKHALTTGSNAGDYTFLYQCIMGKGRMQLIAPIEEKKHALLQIMWHYEKRHDWTFAPALFERVQLWRLDVEEWSCKEHK